MYAYLLKLYVEKSMNIQNPEIKGNFLWVSTIPHYYTKVTSLTKEDFIQTTKEEDEDSEDKSERGKPKYNALKINGELNPLIKKWL